MKTTFKKLAKGQQFTFADQSAVGGGMYNGIGEKTGRATYRMGGIKITIGSQMVEVLPVEKPTLASVKPGELTASGTCGKYYVRDANGGIVFETGANFHDKPFTEDEACANARELVSRWNSQPELLAALKDLIFATAKVESTIAEAALKNARAMLAKAHAKGCNL